MIHCGLFMHKQAALLLGIELREAGAALIQILRALNYFLKRTIKYI